MTDAEMKKAANRMLIYFLAGILAITLIGVFVG